MGNSFNSQKRRVEKCMKSDQLMNEYRKERQVFINEKRKKLDSGIPLTADEKIDLWKKEKEFKKMFDAVLEQMEAEK